MHLPFRDLSYRRRLSVLLHGYDIARLRQEILRIGLILRRSASLKGLDFDDALIFGDYAGDCVALMARVDYLLSRQPI